MGKLTSNYNFVPLNEIVYYPEWANQVSQDIPFSDGEDGIITVTLHNVSPLFTRNGSANRDKKEAEVFSAHVMDGEKRRYFLPATSIKGMLRTTMEIMAFGKMTQYNDRYFSMRDIGGNKTTDSNNYIDLMKGVKPAWLRQEGDKLYLTPCDGEWARIDDAYLQKKYLSFNKEKTAWKRNEAIAKNAGGWYPLYKRNGKNYHIVCTGSIFKKHKEYLFPSGRLAEIEINEQVTKAFFTVHEPSPDFDKIVNRLKSHQEIAVFYLPKKGKGKASQVDAIGISAMMRYPYKQSVADLVKKQQNPNETEHDLVEIIFGYITERGEDSLRGRVQIGNAFAERSLADDELEEKVGVLRQPKASFYPFYLKQTSNPYKTYKNADGIAGRKLYRVHQGSTVTALPPGNNNENTTSSFRPIPVGLTFQLKIVVHNLRKVETGALLSAINLHGNNDKAWHNIGMARGYGYGKLKIDNISLSQGFSSSIEDYMKAFEKEMSLFTFKYLQTRLMWADTPQMVKLISILGEHTDNEIRVMEINSPKYGKEYKKAKQHFDKLTERNIKVKSLLSEADKNAIKSQSIP